MRSRKLKCDKGSPCINCTKNSRPCVFIASGLDADGQKRLAEVKEKMGILERSLEEDVARERRTKSATASENRRSSTLPGQDESYSDQEDDEDTRNLNPTHLATEDAAYYDGDADNDDDDIVDLGIAMGKVRISERIGGLVRPRFSEEVNATLVSYNFSLTRDSARPSPSRTAEKRAPKSASGGPARSARLVGTQPRLCCAFIQLVLRFRG